MTILANVSFHLSDFHAVCWKLQCVCSCCFGGRAAALTEGAGCFLNKTLKRAENQQREVVCDVMLHPTRSYTTEASNASVLPLL